MNNTHYSPTRASSLSAKSSAGLPYFWSAPTAPEICGLDTPRVFANSAVRPMADMSFLPAPRTLRALIGENLGTCVDNQGKICYKIPFTYYNKIKDYPTLPNK